MPVFLSSRNTTETERMEDPDCDRAELENTYEQFKTINTLVSQWRTLYRNELRPHLRVSAQNRILDIGFGGGDIPMKLAGWAARDGINLHITAVDSDERAFNFVQQMEVPDNLEFLNCSSSELLHSGRQYDFVLSNHLLHHLSQKELRSTLSEARRLSRKGVIFNDIRRSDLGYLLFNMLARPVFRSSFITQDGLTSIRRSYTPSELAQAVPPGWQVRKLFPFRLLLTYRHE
ncbi:class I SAM-dependent methyltransferase [Fodinibius sp.]|uniref:class I SAM-dependent methyltransferase n=1 Tax=Fodinibius sp. TaxID=1872440 RepID=UPI0035644FE1